MTVEFKAGTLEDFFTSAKETAREIDAGKKVTRKNTILRQRYRERFIRFLYTQGGGLKERTIRYFHLQ